MRRAILAQERRERTPLPRGWWRATAAPSCTHLKQLALRLVSSVLLELATHSWGADLCKRLPETAPAAFMATVEAAGRVHGGCGAASPPPKPRTSTMPGAHAHTLHSAHGSHAVAIAADLFTACLCRLAHVSALDS